MTTLLCSEVHTCDMLRVFMEIQWDLTRLNYADYEIAVFKYFMTFCIFRDSPRILSCQMFLVT